MSSKVFIDKALEVLTSGRAAEKSHDETVRVRVYVDPTAPGELVSAVRKAFVALRPGGIVDVLSLACGYVEDDVTADVVLVIPGANESAAADAVAAYARRGTHVGVLVESSVDAPHVSLDEVSASFVEVMGATDSVAATSKVARWLVRATDKGIAFAANFPFCRDEEIEALIGKCALENTAVGAVSILPGSDMPIMTANQAKLALDIAAAYGQSIDVSRAAELVGVLGAGFAYRAAARSLVGLVPGLGWAVKAGMGYAGTVSTGHALKARFDIALDGPDETVERGREAVQAAREAAGQIVRVSGGRVSAPRARATEATSRQAEREPRPGDFDYLVIGGAERAGE